MDLPLIGLGTWELTGAHCTEVVQQALELGYRHIDTAYFYQNHKDIAKAIKGLARGSFYITSKIAIDEQIDRSQPEKSVLQACERALDELDTDYLDLYLIHAPDRSLPMDIIYKAMEALVRDGKIRKAGVSNFTIHHLEDLRHGGAVPYANQVEFHPYLYQKDLLEYCQRHGIRLISYRSFGKGKLLQEEPLFTKIGLHHKKTGAQVILRWLIQKGIAVIPKASSWEHLQQNLDVLDFQLTETEMALLDDLSQEKRYCRPDDPEYRY